MSTPPGSAARDQLSRLLTLVPYLNDRDGVSVEDAAAALGVAPRQVIRDLKVLFMCGTPGGLPGDLIDVDIDAFEGTGDGMIRVSGADYLARPVRLDALEASALLVALEFLSETADERTRAVIERTRAKLTIAAAGSLDATLPAHIADGPDQAFDEMRPVLREAIDAGHQVRIKYWVPSRDEAGTRTVDPRALIGPAETGVAGHWYLEGWCHRAKAPRLFRLDRIDALEVTDEPVAEHPEPRIDVSQGVLGPALEAQRVTLRLAPPALWIAEYYPARVLSSKDDGALDVELPVADPRWLERLILRSAPHVEVIAPVDLRARVSATVAQTLRLYQGGGVR